jgi:hypothetical protein
MTETQLRRVCEDLFRDRATLQSFNPNLPERDAVFLVLYGSLASLLDAPADFAPEIADGQDIYVGGALALLQQFAPELTAAPCIVNDLAARLTV